MYPQTLLTLPLLIALTSPVLAEDDKALLAKCDGMTRAGTIDPALKDGVIGGFAEKQCKTKAEIARLDASIAQKDASIAQKDASIAQKDASIAQKDASIAQSRAEIAKLDEILALLNPAEAKKVIADEILRMEKQLSQEKNPTTVKSLESKLNALRTEQQKLK